MAATALIAAACSVTGAACASWANDRDYSFIRGGASGRHVHVEAFRQPQPGSDTEASSKPKPTAGTSPTGHRAPPGSKDDHGTTKVRQWRATPELCQLSNLSNAAPALRAECESEGQRLPHRGVECDVGQEAQGALFEQRRSGDTWTVPRVVEEDSCRDVGGSTEHQQRRRVDIPAAAERAFRNMTIKPSALSVQPPNGWTLVNLDTIAYAEDDPRTLRTTLFDIPVTIRAVPDSYAWDWGDGASTTGTDPGAPYPDHTVAHAYSAPGTTTITLTTTWHGEFRLQGDPIWHPVPGEATTSSQSPTIDIREARTRLVEDLSR
ncbi:hypothetical protein [Myceligenerans indicum]|uniref:hypothetical protein n=1 Tax=Myceligenerans indicum TaxID=2593663 RepID=UPI00191F7B40|nr:hypothetical protein [Myceligenerans indicum]